ncbi:MAG: hypothetical protein HY319_16735, partial [Armatimonadetes bacterium]|nr:hypothetical protein [Armatimonadota bacterium]
MVYERYFYRATEELSLGPTDFLPDPERPLLFEEAPIGLLSWKRLAEPCVVVLGDSGLGKTTFLKRQCQAQPDGLWLDLGEARMVQEHKTVKSWIQGEPYLLTLFLDGLDEWPSAKGNVTKLLERDLRDLPADRLRLRLSCRPHDWLRSLQELLELLWPAQVGIYSMAPLRGRDVADRVRHEGLDPDAFGRELERTGLHPLATRPLTLEFLLDGFRRQGQMASTPGELFQGGCRRLARRGPAGDLEAPRRLAVAERIAAMCELGGYRLVQLDKDPGDSTVLAYGEIALGQESSRQQEFDVTESLVQQTLQTALFHNGRWSHKSYAEFLAAEYLERRLTVEQVTDLLLEPVTGLVYPQLREVAAWFASSSRGFFERLAAQQPDVLLIGLAGLPQEWQRRSLLEKLCHWLDHNPVANPWRLRGYEKFYPRKSGEKARLAEQLRPLLLFPTSSARSRVAAVVTAIKCGIDDLQADLVTLAVGPATPLEVKDLAAWGVVELGNDASRRQLKVLLDDLSGDHQDELKGLVLQALWPDSLTFEELLPLLTPPRQPELFGAYRSFLTDHLAQKCKDEDISRALRWVVRAPGWDALSSFEDLTDGLVTKGLERFERPEVADALTDAVLTLLRSERSYWLTNCERFCDELGRSPGLRRDLVGRLVNRLAPEGQVKLLDRTNAFSFSEEDSRWILQEIERAPDATRKAWGELLGSPRLPPSESVLPDMRRLAERFPELKDTWVRHLAPPPPPHEAGPTRRVLVAQVRGILQKQPSAEVGWPVVVSLLLRGRECLLSAFLHPAASNQSLWDLLDPDERGQILDMAQHYLAKAEPHTASWWLSPRLDPTVPSAWAALDLLRKERTDVFSSLPPAVWSR